MRRIREVLQYGDIEFLVAQGGIRVVEVFFRQLCEMGEHGAVGCACLHHPHQGAVCCRNRRRREQIDEIGECLFGDLGSGYQRGVPEVEIVPVVCREVIRAGFGRGQCRGDVGQFEILRVLWGGTGRCACGVLPRTAPQAAGAANAERRPCENPDHTRSL